ncbi:MAG TPA: hypothetical protein DD490_27145 [Acidobacteria bacterium]|nr:hypothetical protein [Acidobacteriota bacterium]
MIPRASFWKSEGRLLQGLLWLISALFICIMVITWKASEKAHPVLLDLETGKPVAERPAL